MDHRFHRRCTTAFLALNITIENLSAGGTIAQSDFQQLTLYRNPVSPTLDGNEVSVATLPETSIGIDAASSFSFSDEVPAALTYYFVTGTMKNTIADGRAFRLSFGAGGAFTGSGGFGTAFTANDANSVLVDIVATQLVVDTEPADANVFDTANDEIVSGTTFDTQPIVSARDANGNIDIDFSEDFDATASPGTLSGTLTITPSGGPLRISLTPLRPTVRR